MASGGTRYAPGSFVTKRQETWRSSPAPDSSAMVDERDCRRKGAL